MFQSENVMVTDSASNHHLETTDQALEKIWANEYEQYKTNWRSSLINSNLQSGTSRAEHHTTHISVQNVHQGRDDVHMADFYQHEQSGSIHIASTSTDTLSIPNELDVAESLITEFTLNKEQTQAFSMVAEHSCRDKPEQLRMFLGGPGGTGKSQVINALHTFFQRKREDRRFRLAAYTGVAAHNIQGMTLHAALRLNQQRKGNSSRVTQDLITMWRGVDYLFIDEVSMIGCKFLFKLHEALCVAKEDKRPFGGINIIFAGDFTQLPPVGDTRFCSKLNTRRKATNAGQNEMFGKLLWLSVDKCVMLKDIMRQRGPENQPFIQLLQRLRTGQCNEDDYELLNSKLLCNAEPDWSQEEWRESPVIVSNNEAKDLINLKCAEAFAARTGHELHYYHALDRQGGKVIDHTDLKERLKSLHTGNTVQRAGLLPLVIGMPVMICANFDIPNGVVNGSIGILKEVRYTMDQNNDHHAHACIVSLPISSGTALFNLNIGETPILEDTTAMSFTHPHSHCRCSIKRTQLPIVPAFALTAHKSQGKTLDTAIVDIQSCRGTESVYVMLSRVTSIRRLRILRPFNIKKIQCRPSEDSQKEVQRLSILQINCAGQGPTHNTPMISHARLSATLDSLEDPEELNAIQMAVNFLPLPDLAVVHPDKRPSSGDNEKRLLKKRRLNVN